MEEWRTIFVTHLESAVVFKRYNFTHIQWIKVFPVASHKKKTTNAKHIRIFWNDFACKIKNYPLIFEFPVALHKEKTTNAEHIHIYGIDYARKMEELSLNKASI
jgi:hypothetical protein